MTDAPTVFLVMHEGAIREAVLLLLKSANHRVETFGLARDFLSAYDPGRPGCLLLDVHLTDMSGLALQAYLAARGMAATIVFITTGQGDVPTAVWATQRGAVDFIEKPLTGRVLLDSINRAIHRDAENRQNEAKRCEPMSRFSQLTNRERQVLDLVVAGKATKQIASTLHISTKTVEAHRGRIMAKMKAQGLADLVRQVLVARAHSPQNSG